MLSLKKANIIAEIEQTILRFNLYKGVYDYAVFTFRGNKFRVYRHNDGCTQSVILKNGSPVHRSVVANGRYYNISLGGSESLMEHQLLAVCLIEGASSRLVKDDKAVINHKTISSETVNAMRSRNEYIYQSVSALFDDTIVPDESLYADISTPDCNVDDLEICSSSENNAHGRFIRTFGLYDTRISALDVPLLQELLIDKDIVDGVIGLYTRYGVGVLIHGVKDSSNCR